MNKQQFLAALRRKLAGLPKKEVKERLAFYHEMIDDRMEEGLSEEEAVLAIGSIDELALQIASERLFASKEDGVKKSVKKLSGWEIALMAIGSPIWLPLLIAALAVIGSVYAVIWSIIVVIWVVESPFLIMGFISKYLFIFCKKATICTGKFTKLSASGIAKTLKESVGGKEK